MTKLPTLDDRTYAEFAGAARALIPTLSPDWTDHNPSDPGIVLMELLAWLAEIVLYRIDRVPERSYRTFLDLLRGPPHPPDPGDIAPLDATSLDGLALDAAIRKTIAQLRDRHRAITVDDFEYLALRRWPTLDAATPLGVPGVVRRVLCIAEQTPASLLDRWKGGAQQDGHVTVVVVPNSLAAARSDLPAFDPARRYALELDGTAAYVDCGADASLSLLAALTVSAWIFPRSLTARQGIVCKAATGEYELVLEPASGQATAAITFTQADGTPSCSVTGGAIAAGRWTHVAVVRAADGKSVTLFVDGQAVATKLLAKVPVASTKPVQIGRRSDNAGFFDGFVRDAAIWNRARTATELGGDLRHPPLGIDDVAGLQSPPPTAVACWRLDTLVTSGPVPDCETPAAAPVAQRHRDGTLHAAVFRDVVRPLSAAPALLAGLAAMYDEWRLLTTRVDVVGYTPLRVTVTATLYLRPDADAAAVGSNVSAALDRFLDPLTGYHGAGWPFGRAIYNFDLQSVLDAIPGVDFVIPVQVTLTDPAQVAAVAAGTRPPPPHDELGAPIGVSLQPNELPSFNNVVLTIVQRSGAR